MDPIDVELYKRLEKLKEPIQPVPQQDEIERKLRELQGLPQSSGIEKKYILLPQPKTQTEQVDDLLKQYSEEVTLPSSSTATVDEIERRLRNLNPQRYQQDSKSPQLPRESDTKILLKKVLAEAELEKKMEQQFPESKLPEPVAEDVVMNYSESDSDDSEDDFCSICDKSPKWICTNCDKELYCDQCYREYHDDIGECHSRKPVVRKKKRKW